MPLCNVGTKSDQGRKVILLNITFSVFNFVWFRSHHPALFETKITKGFFMQITQAQKNLQQIFFLRLGSVQIVPSCYNKLREACTSVTVSSGKVINQQLFQSELVTFTLDTHLLDAHPFKLFEKVLPFLFALYHIAKWILNNIFRYCCWKCCYDHSQGAQTFNAI